MYLCKFLFNYINSDDFQLHLKVRSYRCHRVEYAIKLLLYAYSALTNGYLMLSVCLQSTKISNILLP
jgi:hypothetical protein